MSRFPALLLLFFAFSFVAAAQSLTGLSQYGVTISGAPPQISFTNNGQKAIAAVVFAITYNDGNVGPWKVVIVPGVFSPDGVTRPLLCGWPSPLEIAAISVDGLVLSDGSYVGPDVTHSFQEMAKAVSDSAYVAGLLNAGATPLAATAQAWANVGVEAAKADQDTTFPRKSTAKVLMNLRDHGDSVALAAAQVYLGLAPLRTLSASALGQ